MLVLDTDMVVLDTDILIMVNYSYLIYYFSPSAIKSSKALCQLAGIIQYPALGRNC